jgi:hypothetical protein
MSVTTLRSHPLQPAELAKWLRNQPERWWFADGDDVLMSEVDLSCPSDELAEAILRHNKPLRIYESLPVATPVPQVIKAENLDSFVDTRNRHHWKTLFLSWEGSDMWMLVEDSPLEG